LGGLEGIVDRLWTCKESFAFHPIDLGGHLVERRLDRVLARRREVRDVGFGSRTPDLEMRRLVADDLERLPRLANRLLLGVERGAERLRRVVGDADLIAQVVEGPQILGKLAL